jgi:hypothetical protein
MNNEDLSSALQELVRKGCLFLHQADDLLNRSLNGEHTFILGPHQTGKIKLAQALASDIGKSTKIWPIEKVALRESLLNGLKCAHIAGADYVLLIDIFPADLFWLLEHDSSVCIIATLPVVNTAALWFFAHRSQINFMRSIFGKSVYQVGFNSLGNARLVTNWALEKTATKPFTGERAAMNSFVFPQNWAQDTAKHDPGWELDSEEHRGKKN